MTKILLLTSSPRGEASYSTRVAEEVVARLKTAHPGATLVRRDLDRTPPHPIDPAFIAAAFTPPDQRGESQRSRLIESDALIDELLGADIVVLAVAMINFGIPATLKAWIDNVARAGRTFRYVDGNPEGLVTGKRVILVQAKGGIYEGAARANDFVSPYLRHMLGFLGLSNVETIRVEGTNLGAESAELALRSGLERARHLVPQDLPQPAPRKGVEAWTAAAT